ncbi:MAG: hypothetical protein WC860_00655 [Candidatus Margulisiibacteriota bacterium]|jgi:hypothetical protein
MERSSKNNYPGVTRPAQMSGKNPVKPPTQSLYSQGSVTRSMSTKQNLFNAIIAGDNHTAKALLQKNPGLAKQSIYDPELRMNVPLAHIPVHLNDPRMTKLFVQHGADPEAIDGEGSSAIQHASYDTLPFLQRRP